MLSLKNTSNLSEKTQLKIIKVYFYTFKRQKTLKPK